MKKYKKVVSLIITISLVSMYLQINSFAVETVDYKTGALPYTYEEVIEHLDTTATYATLPTSVDNTSKFPTPGDQGQQNSCVGWALGYALKSNSEYLKRGWTLSTNNHKTSPGYIYNQINNGTDGGARIFDALELMKTQGASTLAYYPYRESNYTIQPNPTQRANAGLYKISGFHTLMGINDIKQRIAQSYGVVISIEVYPDFTYLSQSDSIYDDISGTKKDLGHTICLIGYDDNIGDNGAFKFINSWGTDWGVNGYGWISYDTVKDTSPLQGTAVGFYVETIEDTYMMGDASNNGVIDIADARLALIGADYMYNVTASQYVLADVNGDAKLTESDATEILSVAAGQQLIFSIYQ
ncbi:MAG: peptidase C1 [Clostridia bacterium]|nr:peptidase C1 [Clostridia bacterium]